MTRRASLRLVVVAFVVLGGVAVAVLWAVVPRGGAALLLGCPGWRPFGCLDGGLQTATRWATQLYAVVAVPALLWLCGSRRRMPAEV